MSYSTFEGGVKAANTVHAREDWHAHPLVAFARLYLVPDAVCSPKHRGSSPFRAAATEGRMEEVARDPLPQQLLIGTPKM